LLLHLLIGFKDRYWKSHMTETTIENSAAPDRPLHASIGIWILYAGLAIGLLRMLLDPDPSDPNIPNWFAPVVGSITLVLMAAIVAAMGSGRNWARILFLLMFIAGLPVMYAIAADLAAMLSGRPGATAILVIQTCSQAAALVLVFTPSSNSWYRAAKAYRLSN
jgi:hypothetical protein